MKKLLFLSFLFLSQLSPSSDPFAYLPEPQMHPITSFPSYMKQKACFLIEMLKEGLPHLDKDQKTQFFKKITEAKSYLRVLDEKATKILCHSKSAYAIINGITFKDVIIMQAQIDSTYNSSPGEIKKLLVRLRDAINDGMHPVNAAIQMHLNFLTISSSKRTAQILFNIILMAFGYMPLNFLQEKKYQEALEKTFSGADLSAFERYCIAELHRVMPPEDTPRSSHRFVRKTWSI